MHNRTEAQMLQAYKKIVIRMISGLGTKNHALENDISKEYKAEIKANGDTNELVPQWDHQRNIYDKYIQTHNNHFIGVLAGLHEYFPMNLWWRLFP